MSESPDGRSKEDVPFRSEMEATMLAKVVTYDDAGVVKPGGMCQCCASGPTSEPDWRAEPWYVYQAGLCDSDGVYYAMLCEGCLEEIRDENDSRPKTERDLLAREMRELLVDDLDGAQSMMEDLQLRDETAELEPTPKFELGTVVMTLGVHASTSDDDRLRALGRHICGDWGNVPQEDARQNDWALKNDARLLSSYESSDGVTFWVLTEADRSATTLLLPAEY